MTAFGESIVGPAALAWLECVGWQVLSCAEIAPGEPTVERDDDGEVVLAQWPRELLLALVDGDPQFKDAAKFVGRAG